MATTTDSVESPQEGRREPSTRGRRRDEDRTDEILEAASHVLTEVGYDQLRVQDVADRAGAGTGAIYRRWSTKEALVADAIRAMPDTEYPVTDNPVADLRGLVHQKLEACVAQPDLMPGMIAAMRANPEIAAAVRDRYTVQPFRTLIARIIGDDHPHLDLLAEMPSAVALHRSTFGGTTIDLDLIADQLIDLVKALTND